MTINIEVTKGDLCIFLKGSDVWVRVDLDVRYIGPLRDEVKLFTLPDGSVFSYGFLTEKRLTKSYVLLPGLSCKGNYVSSTYRLTRVFDFR